MKRCAFLTLADPTGFTIDDNLAYAPLAELGWSVEAIPWRQSEVDWEAFDAAIIRSTWDYSDHPGDFLAALDEIELSGTPLFNPAKLVRWNLHKTYLRELESRGVAIVPTI